jgi:hypothetical protein
MISILMKYNTFKSLLVFTIYHTFLFVAWGQNHNVSIQRSCLSTFGNSSQTDLIYLNQSAGQSLGFLQSNSSTVLLNEGFVQSLVFSGLPPSSDLNCYIYPNPNDGEFILFTDLNRLSHYAFSIYDSFGKVWYKSFGEGGVDYNVNIKQQVPPGVYFVQITTTNGLIGSVKIVIL